MCVCADLFQSVWWCDECAVSFSVVVFFSTHFDATLWEWAQQQDCTRTFARILVVYWCLRDLAHFIAYEREWMVFLFCGRWSFCAYAVIVCLKFSFRFSRSHTNKQTNKYKHVHLLSRALLLSIFNCWSIVVYAFDYTVAWLLYFASDLALVVFGFVAIDADVGFFFYFIFVHFLFFSSFLSFCLSHYVLLVLLVSSVFHLLCMYGGVIAVLITIFTICFFFFFFFCLLQNNRVKIQSSAAFCV